MATFIIAVWAAVVLGAWLNYRRGNAKALRRILVRCRANGYDTGNARANFPCWPWHAE